MMNKKLFIVILLTLISAHAVYFYGGTVEYLVNFISAADRNGLVYRWPRSAHRHYAKGQPKKFGTYDFVIIGAGAGGSAAANRLTEIENWKVLVLEAGTFGNTYTDVPNLNTQALFSKYNWAYNSTPQSKACLGLVNRQCHFPRGKGVGGSSLINGLIYVRGHKSDYDKWAKLVGDNRWGYDTVLNYFKRTERLNYNNPQAPIEPQYHGQNGLNNVEFSVGYSPQLDAFVSASRELNLGVSDYNANKLGASPIQFNTLQGRRFHNARAFLYPIKHRRNLRILSDSYVTKIRTTKHKNHVAATGVEFSHKGRKFFVEANKEVILSAGTFASPQILMLSGIGPKYHLQSLGIDVVRDLEVGSTLRDHPTFLGLNFVSNYSEPVRPSEDVVTQFLVGSGALTVPSNAQGLGFYESSYSKGTGVPDIELMFVAANATSNLSQRNWGFTDQTYRDTFQFNDVTRSFIIYVTSLHAKSVGTVRLKSKDPYEYPLIDIGLLTDPENRDINTIYEGIQIVLKMMQTKAFRAINANLQGGLTKCKKHLIFTKNYWYCAIRELGMELYHTMSTCAMGRDPKHGAVVDSELRVFGVDRLRVADASVIPLTIGAHLNTPTIMVGEQLADVLKKAHGEHKIGFRNDWIELLWKR